MILSFFFFFKQKTAYEMRISDWSSDVCSSDLLLLIRPGASVPADGLVVSSTTAANSMKELAAHTQANLDKSAYGSFGVGSQPHLMGEMYNKLTGSDRKSVV